MIILFATIMTVIPNISLNIFYHIKYKRNSKSYILYEKNEKFSINIYKINYIEFLKIYIYK